MHTPRAQHTDRPTTPSRAAAAAPYGQSYEPPVTRWLRRHAPMLSQATSLADQIQTALMLAYNNRRVG